MVVCSAEIKTTAAMKAILRKLFTRSAGLLLAAAPALSICKTLGSFTDTERVPAVMFTSWLLSALQLTLRTLLDRHFLKCL